MRKPVSIIFLFFLALGFSLLSFNVQAQQLKLGNNPTFINPAAVLQLDSRNQGLLLTRVEDTAAINSFTPPDGMIIYFTDSSATGVYGPNAGVYQRKNGTWIPLWGVGYGNDGQVLRARGTNIFPVWENLLLDSLYNVQISSPDTGQILQYNGSKWINWTPTYTSLNGTGYVKMNGTTPTYITAIPNSDLANSTISGVALGGTLFSLSPGYGLVGSAYNGTVNQQFNVDTSSGKLATQYYVNTQGFLKGNQAITLSGDVTGSGTTSIPVTLNTVNSNIGTFGNATNVGTFTVNAKGLITAASNTPISFPVTSVNGFTGAVSLGLNNLSGVSISLPNSGQVLTYNGSNWVNSSTLGSYWSLTGNAGTTPATNFLGTTDAQPLYIKIYNTISGYIGTSSTSATYFGFGSSANPTNSTAIGSGASAGGQYAMAIGSGASASAKNAIAIGQGANALNQNSIVIGNGISSAYQNTIILGGSGMNVGIGTTNPTTPLYVNGAVTATAYNLISDVRFKKDLHELTHVLILLDSLHGYTYFFRTKEFKDKNFPKAKQIGMIAQEVEKYFPELVSTDKEGYKSLNYQQFTAVLLEAVKEQQAEIDSLKKQNEQYQQTVNEQLKELTERIQALEKKEKN
jgi:hypothetical protein